MFLALSVVLLMVHAAYSVVIYHSAKASFHEQRTLLNQRHSDSLDGLVSSSYERLLELAEMLALMSEQQDGGPKNLGQVAKALGLHFDKLQLNGSVDAVYLFGYDGSLVEGIGLPLNISQQLIQSVLATERPARELVCGHDCLRYVAIPIQLANDELGVLVVGRALIDVVLSFNSQQGRSIGLAFQVEPPDGDLPELGLSLRYLTDKSDNLKILREFSRRFTMKPEGGVYSFYSEGRLYEVALQVPLGLDDGVAYWLLVDDLTEANEQLWKDLVYSFLLLGSGLIIVALLQLTAMGRSFRNMENLAKWLPRLATSSNRKVQERALSYSSSLFRDELDTLINGVSLLTDELNKLENKHQAQAHALEESAYKARRDGQFVQSLLDNAIVIILVQSGDGRIISLNHYGQRVFGLTADSLNESMVYFSDMIANADEVAIDFKTITDICNGRLTQSHTEMRVKSAGQGELDYAWVHSRLHGDEARPPAVLSMGIDITERKTSERRVYWLANHNSLTSLPNRYAMASSIASRISLARGQNREFALLLCGLDGFKDINDSMGHEFGDSLLKAVAKRFSECVKGEGTVGHFSSDQFMLMTEVSEKHGALDAAERAATKILTAFRTPFVVNDYEIFSTMSVGVAIYPNHGRDESDLVRHADIALYQAKGAGKNQARFYDDLLGEKEEARFSLKSDLYKVVEKNQLTVHYQPQVDALSGQIFGVEALVRWQHPEIGMISPAQFIPLAEETGLIWEIGRWVLHEACAQLVEWQKLGVEGVTMSVNLARQQLFNEMLLNTVDEVLEETGLDPKWLDLEITENFLVKQPGRVKPKLEKLRSQGIQISMDDFGTGFSSLSHLRDLPVDRLKIDRSFIQVLESDERARAVVETIIVLGRNLDMAVLAEGVETKEQLDILRARRCHEIQGYYYSKPLPADQALEYLQQANHFIDDDET